MVKIFDIHPSIRIVLKWQKISEKIVSHVAIIIKRNWRASNDEKLCAEERKFIFIIAKRFIRPGFIAKSNSVRKKIA